MPLFSKWNGTNVMPNWYRNSTAINMSSLVNNMTHLSNATAPTETAPNQSASVQRENHKSIFLLRLRFVLVQ